MIAPDYVRTYRKTLDTLTAAHGRDRAMELVVGGQYDQIGILEGSALKTLGLQPSHVLVDIGCGSGRLPFHLRNWLRGEYVGIDIVHEPLDYAREKCGRLDWLFATTWGPKIPLEDAAADFVTFFSVFTHLLDEDIFRYLAEAKRVSRPGGRIVFSFLDFECDAHWPLFQTTVADPNPDRVLNKFVSKPAIRRWASALELQVEVIYDGSEKWVKLTENFSYEDGRRAEGIVEFGQSIAVLRK